MRKMLQCILLITALGMMNSCIILGDSATDKLINAGGLTIEVDKTSATTVGYTSNSIYIYNITGEAIKTVQVAVAEDTTSIGDSPIFDDHDPGAEPDWTKVDPLTRIDAPTRTDIPQNTAASLAMSTTLNGFTCFFKITADSGKYVVFALIQENNNVWRVQVRKAE